MKRDAKTKKEGLKKEIIVLDNGMPDGPDSVCCISMFFPWR